MKVTLSKRAEREIERIDSRWRVERPAAPELFTDELDAVLDVLPASPEMGKIYGTWHHGELVRRVMLEKSEYHVYYAIEDDELVVITVWGARRGRGPRLGRGH